MDVIAHATRSGDWWAVEVPQIPGLFTQAKRLDQIEGLVVEAAAMLGHEGVRVAVEAALDAEDVRALDDARERSERLALAEREAAVASREAVDRLRSRGLPVRDVAELMKISPQRVSQLGKAMHRVSEPGRSIARASQPGKGAYALPDPARAVQRVARPSKVRAVTKAPSKAEGSRTGGKGSGS